MRLKCAILCQIRKAAQISSERKPGTEAEIMVKLYDGGVYLVNGVDIVPEAQRKKARNGGRDHGETV